MEYFARIQKTEGTYLVSFPDFPNVNTYGDTLEEALDMACDALNASLEVDYERGYALPAPTDCSGKRGYHPVRLLPHVELAYDLKRLRRNMTQGQIAEKLGISYQAYQKLENPRRCNPTIKTLEKIGVALGKRLVVSFR